MLCWKCQVYSVFYLVQIKGKGDPIGCFHQNIIHVKSFLSLLVYEPKSDCSHILFLQISFLCLSNLTPFSHLLTPPASSPPFILVPPSLLCHFLSSSLSCILNTDKNTQVSLLSSNQKPFVQQLKCSCFCNKLFFNLIIVVLKQDVLVKSRCIIRLFFFVRFW